MLAPVTTAYLALGSNLGDRLATLRAAVAALEAAGVRVVGRSAVFETDAIADEPQPPYLNAAVRVQTELDARALLATCLAVERSLGRVRPPGSSKASRTIDLDVVLYADAVIDEAGLRVPHPALLQRPFVLIPLAEVAAPGLRHPVTGQALATAVAAAGVRATGERL
jgi:2-amino-4-hydroxy-6-hydroxymethyldihydropteridine diphosphokinase